MRFALAVAVLASALVNPFDVAAVGPVGDPRPFDSGASLLVPTNGTSADDLDRAGAIETAKHIVEDLSAEGRIDEGWKAAAVAEVENRKMRAFKIWVVHFKSAVDLDDQGFDLFIFVNQKGKFLKHSYDGR
jgi:hypothetical protein